MTRDKHLRHPTGSRIRGYHEYPDASRRRGIDASIKARREKAEQKRQEREQQETTDA